MSLIRLHKRVFYRCIEFIKKIGNNWEDEIAYGDQYSSGELDDKWDKNYRIRLRKFARNRFSHYIEVDDFEENIYTTKNNKKDSPENTDFIIEFCSSGQDYNWMLRKDNDNNLLKDVSEYISQYPIKKEIIVYRGVDEGVLKNNIEAAKGFKNVDLYDKGFLFTSLTKGGIANYHHKLRIYLPQGTCAIYTGNVMNQEQRYQEVVVQRGAKLRILSKDKHFYNCILVETDSE